MSLQANQQSYRELVDRAGEAIISERIFSFDTDEIYPY